MSWHRLPARRSLAALGLLALAACSPAVDRGEIAGRLIAAEPQDPPPVAELFESIPVLSWSFATPEDLEPWTLEGLEDRRLDPQGVSLVSATEDARLSREVAFDAAGIDALEAVMPGPREGHTVLWWRRDGEDFSPERRLVLEFNDDPGRGEVYRFEVASHPLWQGEIRGLRLVPTTKAGDATRLASIAAVRRQVRPAALAAAIEKSWKIELDADVRSGWLAVPGIEISRRIAVGANQRLAFAYGLEPSMRAPVRFVVEARAAGQDARALFSAELRPENGDGGRWLEAVADLDRFAGREVELDFKTESPQPLELGHGFPVWGHPEILGAKGADAAPNVILISVDTLRGDHLSSYGYRRQTSPKVDAWARERAVLFKNAIVQATWTLPSHVSMFTGLGSLRHGVNHFGSMPASQTTLAEMLRQAGYTTAAFTGGGYLRPQFGFAQGFDRFRYWPEIMAATELEDGLGRTLDWLSANRERRFFLFFHTYEVHYPYRRREPYFSAFAEGEGPPWSETRIQMRTRSWAGRLTWGGAYLVVQRPGSDGYVEGLSDQEKALTAAMYDSSIAYLDQQLGRLFAHLDELGLRGRTIVILTSDHGETLGDGDLAGHNYLTEDNLRVPLIIELPGRRGAGKVIEDQVRSIDLVPTVLDLLGLTPPEPVDGVSLMGLVDGGGPEVPAEAWTYAASANFGLSLRYRNRIKYVFNNTAWSKVLGDEQLYDLAADPLAQDNLAPASERTAELRRQAQAWIERRHVGLRLKISHHGPGRLDGRLEGAWKDHARVKAIDPSCRCVFWEPRRAGAFNLASGQSVTLFFEQPLTGRLELAGSLLGLGNRKIASFDEVFEPAEVTAEGVTVAFFEGSWRRRPGSEADVATGFVLWRTGGAGDQPATEPASDPETLKQLRALGYVP